MKRSNVFLPILLVLSMLLVTSAVYAGSINGPEAGLISQASGTFVYQGKTYVSTPASLNRLKAYLSRDDVDLTQEQADRAVSLMYSNVEGGVLDGHLVLAGGETGAIASNSNSILNRSDSVHVKKTKKEKAGKAVVEITEQDSMFRVTRADGKEIFSTKLPVKDTGVDLNGVLFLTILLLLSILSGVLAVCKFHLFTRKNES